MYSECTGWFRQGEVSVALYFRIIVVWGRMPVGDCGSSIAGEEWLGPEVVRVEIGKAN